MTPEAEQVTKEFTCEVDAALDPTPGIFMKLEDLVRVRSGARAVFKDGELSVRCAGRKRVLGLNLQNIKSVTIRKLSIGAQIRAAFFKSIGIGLGAGAVVIGSIVLKFHVIDKVAVESWADELRNLATFFIGVAVIGMLFVFLARAMQSWRLAEVRISDTAGGEHFLYVKPAQVSEINMIFASMGIAVTESGL